MRARNCIDAIIPIAFLVLSTGLAVLAVALGVAVVVQVQTP